MQFQFRDQNFLVIYYSYAEHVLKSTLLPVFVIIASFCLQVQYMAILNPLHSVLSLKTIPLYTPSYHLPQS